LEDQTGSEQGRFVVSETSVTNESALYIARGKVKNNGDDADVLVRLEFTDDDGVLRGANDLVLEGVKKDETRDFELTITGDYMTSRFFEIKVQEAQKENVDE
jgi:hypothetical protein